MKSFKFVSILAALAVLVAFVAPTTTHANTANDAAQKLVDALKAINVDQVDYLYSYVQSVELTDEEYNSILDNANRVAEILEGVTDRSDITKEQQAEAVRLFLDSTQKAHLKTNFVDEKGNAIDLTKIDISEVGSIKVQLKDLDGKLLATVDPKNSDLNSEGIQKNVNALKEAVEAKKVLNETGQFVPMPGAELPNTSTNLPTGIVLGAVILLIGGLALIPAIRTIRKIEA